VNVGTFEKDFTKIVSPELAQNIVYRLRQGEIVEFPNRYELAQVKGKFGGCFMAQDHPGVRVLAAAGLYFCWFLLFTPDYGMRSGLGSDQVLAVARRRIHQF
jgi:hypothetical protein